MASQLLINEPPLQVLPSLAKIVGLNEAIVLQQVHYWLNPQFNNNFFEGRHWVHNTFAQWQKQFGFLSKKTVKRTIANLEESGLLISFVTRNFRKTKYYTLNYDLLNRINLLDSRNVVLIKARPEGAATEQIEGCRVSAEKQGIRSWGQNDPLEGVNVAPSEEPDREDYPESAEKQGVRPWGQNDPLEGVNMAPSGKPEWKDYSSESAGKQGFRPEGQSGPLEGANMALSMGSTCPSPRGQNDPLDGVKMAPFHYTENSSENTSEITLPPLPLSYSSPARQNFEEPQEEEAEEDEEEEEEEEEEENKKIKTKNTKLPIFDRMLQIWNETVQSKIHFGQAVYLTDRREQLLENFLETVLRDRKLFFPSSGDVTGETETSELDAWQHYCNLIAKSRFLAGENASGFKVTLDWALTLEKAYKVLEGAIYDKPTPASQNQPQGQSASQPWEAFAQDIARTLPQNPYSQQWIQISQHLAKKLGQVRYKTWFSKVYLGEIANSGGNGSDLPATVATLHVEGRFIKTYIDANFRFDILEAIQFVCPTIKHLEFKTVPATGDPK